MSEKMRNIGPKSATWLREAGIDSLEALQKVGVEDAMHRMQMLGYRPSKNMEYALRGALGDKDWREIMRREK